MAVINKGGALTISSPNLENVIASFERWPVKAPRTIGKYWRVEGIQTTKKLKRVTSRNLKRRTGQLARSWALPEMRIAFQNITMTFVNEAKYARIQEEGGTITAKNVKFLAIPLDAAKTAAGVARIGPRDLPGRQTFVAKGIIFFKSSKNDPKPTPMFALKESVTLPPRMGAWGVILSMGRRYERATVKAVNKLWEAK